MWKHYQFKHLHLLQDSKHWRWHRKTVRNRFSSLPSSLPTDSPFIFHPTFLIDGQTMIYFDQCLSIQTDSKQWIHCVQPFVMFQLNLSKFLTNFGLNLSFWQYFLAKITSKCPIRLKRPPKNVELDKNRLKNINFWGEQVNENGWFHRFLVFL